MTRIVLPEWTEAQTAPPAGLELLRDVPYTPQPDARRTLHILRPETLPLGPMPVLVGIHGGGWAGGTKDWCLETLLHFAARGYFCAAVGHRFLKDALFPSMIHDCKCAVRYLRAHAQEYYLDPARVGVWGFSSGGHLAALLGTSAGSAELEGTEGWPEQSSAAQAVCDWFGPAGHAGRLEAGEGLEWYGELLGAPPRERPDLMAAFDPVTHITPDAPPFLIMHGDKDEMVPLLDSDSLYSTLSSAGVEATLVVVGGAGHGLVRYDTHSLMLSFFDKHLKAQE